MNRSLLHSENNSNQDGKMPRQLIYPNFFKGLLSIEVMFRPNLTLHSKDTMFG